MHNITAFIVVIGEEDVHDPRRQNGTVFDCDVEADYDGRHGTEDGWKYCGLEPHGERPVECSQMVVLPPNGQKIVQFSYLGRPGSAERDRQSS